MAAHSVVGDEVVYPDGRHALAGHVDLSASPLYNQDLAPVPIERRTWNTYNYAALWIGMAHNIPSYLLASGLILLGMDWVQAIMTIALGNLRGLVACGWFGIQTWIGGQAIFTLTGAVIGKGWTDAAQLGGYPWTQWLSFGVFWLLNIYIILRGMDTLRRFENWAAPFVLLVAIFLLVWMVTKAHGFGPILHEPSKLGWGADFWPVFFPALMGMIAFWSTLSLNMPDFTRFGGSQRQQVIGQVLGLPTTMTLFSLLAILITSATTVVYGQAIWDPVVLTGKFSSPAVIVFALFTLAVATLSVNVAANVVSPSYDFSNAFPKLISFRTGGIITGVLGILIQPWRLLANPQLYIFTWLEFYGGMLGAVAGVLVADYWMLRRTELALGDLYRVDGAYRYASGWNWRGVASVLLGMLLAVGGAHSAPNQGPFPGGGLIPFLRPLYSYSWVVGLLSAIVAYYVLSVLFPARGRVTRPGTTAVTS